MAWTYFSFEFVKFRLIPTRGEGGNHDLFTLLASPVPRLFAFLRIFSSTNPSTAPPTVTNPTRIADELDMAIVFDALPPPRVLSILGISDIFCNRICSAAAKEPSSPQYSPAADSRR